jgi:ribonucrease Y
MSITLLISLFALSGISGIILGYILRVLIGLSKRGSLEIEIKEKVLEAKMRANSIIEKAEEQATKFQIESEEELEVREEKFEKSLERLIKREEFLDERERTLSKELEELKKQTTHVQEMRKESLDLFEKRKQMLSDVAHYSEEEAQNMLLLDIEKTYANTLLVRMQKLEAHGKKQLEEKARGILIGIIHRLGNAVNSEITTTAVTMPNEASKGKVIGKEGRNIKSFERATGVDVLVDEAPDKITLSCFDPVRRYIAKISLGRLIEDGRIQPAKIEETVEKVKKEISDLIQQKGSEAAYEVGIVGLDPGLITLLGRLYFRTSYGQNILTHSIEMAHIAGMLAEELGARSEVAKAGALLHDIGKAVDHEVQGTHVDIGRRILEKYGVSKDIILAMQSHHEEYPYETPESVLVQVADAISAGRPGARRDTAEKYIHRLLDLERLSASFEGVEKVYAIQAGREIRIFVNPGKISDIETHKLAREIAEKIEGELKYPGEIKVNVIRENRVVEFAR